MNKKNRFSNTTKYWNGLVLQFNNSSFKESIIDTITHDCEYNILSIANNGKKKEKKKLNIQDRDLYTPSMGINKELPYLKKYEHYISINPPGKKYLLYLKDFNNKNQAIFINRYKDVHINYEHRMYKINFLFSEELYEGTLIDGQAVKKKDGKWYFVMNDIYMYKGNNIMINSLDERLKILKNIFMDKDTFDIKDDKHVTTFENKELDTLYFEIKSYYDYKHGLDLVTNYYRFFNYFDSDKKFKNNDNNKDGFNGDIPKGIIFTNKSIYATSIYYILPLNKKNTNISKLANIKTDIVLKNIKNKPPTHFNFKLKKTIVSDIYELYCNKDGINILYDNCSITSLISSQKINSYFKSVKVYFDIDIDDYTTEEVIVECIFTQFNKWEPVNKVNDTLTDIKYIKDFEQKHFIRRNDIPNLSMEQYDKNSYSVYNENNKFIDKFFIEELLNKYNISHKIKNLDIIQTAFVHKSYALNNFIKEYKKDKNGKAYIASKVVYNLLKNKKKDNKKECLELFDTSYERLEWFGDAKLEDIISTYLEKRYPNEDEGFLTNIRSKLVRKQTLGYLGHILGFGEYIIMSKQVEKYENGRTCVDILEDCLEALIGALYTEFTEQKCIYKLEKFLINLFESEIDFVDLIYTNDNYKARIMEHFHKTLNKNPYYKEDEDSGENGIFKMYIIHPKTKAIIGSGEDKIKKKAEQYAAHEGLKHLGLI